MYEIISQKCRLSLLKNYNILFVQNLSNSNSNKYILSCSHRDDNNPYSYLLNSVKITHSALEFSSRLSFSTNSFSELIYKSLLCIDSMYYKDGLNWYDIHENIVPLRYPPLSITIDDTKDKDLLNQIFFAINSKFDIKKVYGNPVNEYIIVCDNLEYRHLYLSDKKMINYLHAETGKYVHLHLTELEYT